MIPKGRLFSALSITSVHGASALTYLLSDRCKPRGLGPDTSGWSVVRVTEFLAAARSPFFSGVAVAEMVSLLLVATLSLSVRVGTPVASDSGGVRSVLDPAVSDSGGGGRTAMGPPAVSDSGGRTVMLVSWEQTEGRDRLFAPK